MTASIKRTAAIFDNSRVDTTPGNAVWASPPAPVDDYRQWLIEQIAKDQGTSQGFGFFVNFYNKSGISPNYPDERPVITGPYADDLLKAATSDFGFIIKEAATYKSIMAKAAIELARHQQETGAGAAGDKPRGKQAGKGKGGGSAPKRIAPVVDKEWKPDEATIAKHNEFMNRFNNFLKDRKEGGAPQQDSPVAKPKPL